MPSVFDISSNQKVTVHFHESLISDSGIYMVNVPLPVDETSSRHVRICWGPSLFIGLSLTLNYSDDPDPKTMRLFCK